MIRELVELAARVAEIERRMSGMIRHGTVAEVDPAEGTCRVKFGESTAQGGGDFLGPVVPYAQYAGAFKGHVPVSVGQQVTQIAPGGDWRQAVAVPMTWSTSNTNPGGTQEENVWTFGAWRISLNASRLIATNGSTTVTIDGGDVKVENSGKVEVKNGGDLTLDSGGKQLLKAPEIKTDGKTVLDSGTREVAFKGGKDGQGDPIQEGAPRVFV